MIELFELKMPAEYYGNTSRSGGFTKSDPREWTEQEIAWVQEQMAAGYTTKEIGAAIGRTEVSIEIKMKRLKKSVDTYNDKHRAEKYAANCAFLDEIKPASALDVYAGDSYYADAGLGRLVTNDIDEACPTDHHLDALTLMCLKYSEGESFDLIDLDPFGSAYDCFDLALKMAKKGLVVSFGEWGHKRFRRYDFVRPRYGITGETEFTPDAFVAEIQRIAAINKRSATPVQTLQYGHFLRIYFKLDRRVITEQWRPDQNV